MLGTKILQRLSASDRAKGNKSEDSLGRTLKQPWENCGERTLYSVFMILFLLLLFLCFVLYYPIFMFVITLFSFSLMDSMRVVKLTLLQRGKSSLVLLMVLIHEIGL